MEQKQWGLLATAALCVCNDLFCENRKKMKRAEDGHKRMKKEHLVIVGVAHMIECQDLHKPAWFYWGKN